MTVVVAGDLGGGGLVLGYLLVVGGMRALSAGTLLERWRRLDTHPLDQVTIHCLVSCGAFVAAAAVTGRLAPSTTPPGFCPPLLVGSRAVGLRLVWLLPADTARVRRDGREHAAPPQRWSRRY